MNLTEEEYAGADGKIRKITAAVQPDLRICCADRMKTHREGEP